MALPRDDEGVKTGPVGPVIPEDGSGKTVPQPVGNPAAGLTSQQAEEIRARVGFNDIPEEKKNPFLRFLGYFWGPIPWMIDIAAILSVK